MYINDLMYEIYSIGHYTSHNGEETARVMALWPKNTAAALWSLIGHQSSQSFDCH